MNTSNETNKSKSVWKLAKRSLFFGSVILGVNASSQTCDLNVAKSTTYFVPHIRDYCESAAADPCQAFKDAVALQGSGTLLGGKILKYTGKVEDIGDCETAIGASGDCLIPYVSVAADMDHHRLGDIIEIPSMKGQIIPLPNGKTMIHPGYFIVHDTGGAINGSNRFDFFTGAAPPTEANNIFGYKGAMNMSDKTSCPDRKQFRNVVRSGDEYTISLAAIESAAQGASTGTMIAGSSGVQ